MKKLTLIVGFSIILILSFSVYSMADSLPDTGQTWDYLTVGEDSDYNINPPSYTKLDANGGALPDSAMEWVMVQDNVTGLIWEVKADDDSIHDKDNLYTWYNSNSLTNGGNAGTAGTGTDTEDFIKTLNANNFGGFSDWRLPTVKELTNIVNRGASSPAINTDFFPQTIASVASYYWSSTTYAGDNSRAWIVHFINGGNGPGYKSESRYVRAVRGRQEWALGHLVVNGDATVTDTSTGLMWQQETAKQVTEAQGWQQWPTYCETLSLAGYDDWRLPNINELQSLVDHSKDSPAINTVAFPDTKAFYYWSSTTYNADFRYAWYVYFSNGFIGKYEKSQTYYVRAVRGGQNQTSDHLVISAPDQASTWKIGDLMIITWNIQNVPGNVKISISRQGGRDATFETIAESTENDGSYEWKVIEPGSVNCILKIEPLDDPSKGNTQGLFSIRSIAGSMPWIPLLLLDD